MKVKHYNEMMAYLTRPGFNGGGSVRNKTVLPKRKPKAEIKRRQKINYEKIKQYLGEESQDFIERELGFAVGGRVNPAQLKQRFMQLVASIQDAEAEEIPGIVAQAKQIKDQIDEINLTLSPDRQIKITSQGLDFDNPLLDAAKIAQAVGTEDIVPETLTKKNPILKAIVPDFPKGIKGTLADPEEKEDLKIDRRVGVTPGGEFRQASMKGRRTEKNIMDYFRRAPSDPTATEGSFAEGGDVDTPKRGLVDEPGSYSQEKILGTNQFGEPIELSDLNKKQKRILRKYEELSGKKVDRVMLGKIYRNQYSEKSLYDPQNPWMVDQKAQALADAIKQANDGDKFIKRTDIIREVTGSEKGRVYFKGADKLFKTLDTQQDKVDKVFLRLMNEDVPIPKYINKYVGELTGITDEKQIKKYLINNKTYKKNEKLIKYLGSISPVVERDLADMSFRQQLDFAEDSLKGRTKFTGLPKGGSYLFRDANLDVMQFAKRNFDQNKGKGLIKFFDRKTGKEIKWKPGGKLALQGVSFTYGKNPQKYDFKYLRNFGKGNPLFKKVYESRQAINDMLNTDVDNPYKPGTKIKYGKLMSQVYEEGFGYDPNVNLYDIGHGEGGVKKEPFKGVGVQTKRSNIALRDIDKIPLKGLKNKLIGQVLGKTQNKSGAPLIKAIMKQELNMAERVVGGEKFPLPARLQAAEGLVTEGILGPREKKFALDMFIRDKKGGTIQLLEKSGIRVSQCFIKKGLKKGGILPNETPDECVSRNIQAEIDTAKKTKNLSKFKALKGFVKGALVVDIPLELMFTVPHLLYGDTEAAKRNSTGSIFGAGGDAINAYKQYPDAMKYADTQNSAVSFLNHYGQLNDLDKAIAKQEELYNQTGNEKVGDRINALTSEYNRIGDLYNNTLARYENKEIGYGNDDEELKGKRAFENATLDIDKKLGENRSEFLQEILPVNKPAASLEEYIANQGRAQSRAKQAIPEMPPGMTPPFDLGFIKDPRDSYSDLPLKFASELGPLEVKETKEIAKEKQIDGILKGTGVPFADQIPNIADYIKTTLRGYAGGGIAKEGGVESGVAPESGPTPDGPKGLFSALKYVKKS
jgi:hypothetical protein